MTTQTQTDWVGYEKPVLAVLTCPQCNKPMPRFYDTLGRIPKFCSDACKMKAYRQRNKQKPALRNVIDQSNLNFVLEKHTKGVWLADTDLGQFCIILTQRHVIGSGGLLTDPFYIVGFGQGSGFWVSHVAISGIRHEFFELAYQEAVAHFEALRNANLDPKKAHYITSAFCPHSV
jgi:hypothetical protein